MGGRREFRRIIFDLQRTPDATPFECNRTRCATNNRSKVDGKSRNTCITWRVPLLLINNRSYVNRGRATINRSWAAIQSGNTTKRTR